MEAALVLARLNLTTAAPRDAARVRGFDEMEKMGLGKFPFERRLSALRGMIPLPLSVELQIRLCGVANSISTSVAKERLSGGAAE